MYAVGTGTLPQFLAEVYEKKKECDHVSVPSAVLRHSSRTPTLNAANSTIFIRQYVLSSIQLKSNWNCSRKGHHSQTESFWGVKDVSGLVETTDARGNRGNNGDRKVTWSL